MKTATSGAHTAGETAGTNTSLDDYIRVFGGACDSGGNVTTLAGQNKTCSLTNSRKARLTVNKVTVPSNDAGRFNLQIDGTTAGTGANVGHGGTTGTITLSTLGTHTVGETAGTGTVLADFTTVISGDCAADGSIIVTAGDLKTCTITNTRKIVFSGPIVASPASIFPADRRLVRVTASVPSLTGPFTPPIACAILSVIQNTPQLGSQPDFVLVPPLAVDLRAERPSSGVARTYTLNVRCTDATGAGSNGTVVVPVLGVR